MWPCREVRFRRALIGRPSQVTPAVVTSGGGHHKGALPGGGAHAGTCRSWGPAGEGAGGGDLGRPPAPAPRAAVVTREQVEQPAQLSGEPIKRKGQAGAYNIWPRRTVSIQAVPLRTTRTQGTTNQFGSVTEALGTDEFRKAARGSGLQIQHPPNYKPQTLGSREGRGPRTVPLAGGALRGGSALGGALCWEPVGAGAAAGATHAFAGLPAVPRRPAAAPQPSGEPSRV